MYRVMCEYRAILLGAVSHFQMAVKPWTMNFALWSTTKADKCVLKVSGSFQGRSFSDHKNHVLRTKFKWPHCSRNFRHHFKMRKFLNLSSRNLTHERKINQTVCVSNCKHINYYKHFMINCVTGVYFSTVHMKNGKFKVLHRNSSHQK